MSEQATAVGDLVADVWGGDTAPTLEFVSAARRIRLLLTQSVGSLFAHAAGGDLIQRAATPDGAGLSMLIEHIRVGAEPVKAS